MRPQHTSGKAHINEMRCSVAGRFTWCSIQSGLDDCVTYQRLNGSEHHFPRSGIILRYLKDNGKLFNICPFSGMRRVTSSQEPASSRGSITWLDQPTARQAPPMAASAHCLGQSQSMTASQPWSAPAARLRSVLADQLDALERISRHRGWQAPTSTCQPIGLRAESEQGITIDVAYRRFVEVTYRHFAQYTLSLHAG
jgi:hypothetical protein